MTAPISLGPVHHVALRVADRARSARFYQALLGFQTVAALPDVTLMSNGALLLGLRDRQEGDGDRFDEFRIGLDHLSFTVNSRADLERALEALDQQDVPHGEIEDLGQDFGLYVLAFRDPDNIQLELTATYR
jgi:catechol 2,3-dioxygenase-like lactoylglutathione lyase family enzyme